MYLVSKYLLSTCFEPGFGDTEVIMTDVVPIFMNLPFNIEFKLFLLCLRCWIYGLNFDVFIGEIEE